MQHIDIVAVSVNVIGTGIGVSVVIELLRGGIVILAAAIKNRKDLKKLRQSQRAKKKKPKAPPNSKY